MHPQLQSSRIFLALLSKLANEVGPQSARVVSGISYNCQLSVVLDYLPYSAITGHVIALTKPNPPLFRQYLNTEDVIIYGSPIWREPQPPISPVGVTQQRL